MALFPPLPRLDPDQPSGTSSATGYWMDEATVKKALHYVEGHSSNDSPFIIGKTDNYCAIDDDRHGIVIAGSRAGKGVSLNIPAHLSYPYSILSVDVKGELSSTTAMWRAKHLGQKVNVLDPYRISTVPASLQATLNPLIYHLIDDPELIDNMGGISDAIVISGQSRDAHWDETARAVIRGLLLFIIYECGANIRARSLTTLRRYVTLGKADDKGVTSFKNLLRAMMKVEGPLHDVIAGTAAMLMDMGENELGSVMSTVRRNTEFLDSPLIQASLESSDIRLEDIKQHPKGMTCYLVLPEWRLATHARWLRLILTTFLQSMKKTKRGINPKTGRQLPATMMLLDEFPTLGRMSEIERAAGYIAGYGVRLVTILQDLNQLKHYYPGTWETFIGNAGFLLTFGNTDLTTLEYISRRLGQAEIMRTIPQYSTQEGSSGSRVSLAHTVQAVMNPEQLASALGGQNRGYSSGSSTSYSTNAVTVPLLTPQEVSTYFSRESGNLLALIAGAPPIRLKRIRYYDDPMFMHRAQPNPFHT